MYLRNKISFTNLARLVLKGQAELNLDLISRDPSSGDSLEIRFKDLKKVFKKNPISLDDSKPFIIRLRSDLSSQEYYISHFNRNDIYYGNCFTIVKNDEWVNSENRYPKENRFCYVELSEDETIKYEKALEKEINRQKESA